MSFVPTLTLSGWDYSDVVDRMDALGFLLLSESTEPPLLAGEPELAQFTHRHEQAGTAGLCGSLPAVVR